MESRDLTRLIADVRFLADVEGQTARHPDADITKRINSAIRALRALCTTNGLPYFLTSTSPATLASTQVSGEAFSEVPFPATAVQIHGVDIESASGIGDWYPLEPISWVQRRNYGGVLPSSYSAPQAFAVRALPQGDGTTGTTAGVIALFPAANSGRFKIWFLADFSDLDAPTDVFLGLPDWHDWVVWTVVEDLAARDDDQRETAALAARKKQLAEANIIATAQRVVSAGPLRPRRRSGRAGWHRGI